MIWYIITLVSFFCCLISHFIGLKDTSIILSLFCAIFFIASIWMTLYAIFAQKVDKIYMDEIKEDTDLRYESLKILIEEYKIKEKLILEHEKYIIEKLSISVKDGAAPQGDNILSHNLLAQIPKLEAVKNINKLYNKITNERDYIISHAKNYNGQVSKIKNRQGNTLIFSPFVPRYEVSYYVISFPES